MSDPTRSTDVVPAAEAGLEKAIDDTVQATERKLKSEDVVVAAPLSYHGSAVRIWKLTRVHDHVAYKIALGICAVVLIVGAWVFVTAWYVVFGLLLVPYRLIRRGARKRKREALQHREMLDAIEKR
jgi:hypothetical protein